jgi:hypothetical protein
VIQKATPDGQHIESIIVDGLETADGIVVDSTGRKVAQKVNSYVSLLSVSGILYITKYTTVLFHLFTVPYHGPLREHSRILQNFLCTIINMYSRHGSFLTCFLIT